MTSRERLLTVLRGDIPDCVPVAPDFSNMIPARLTGKPFWDLYLYNDPPIWEAYINCAKHFDIDSVMDGYFNVDFPNGSSSKPLLEHFIVYRDNDRIVVQPSFTENRKRTWLEQVDVYYRDNPPTHGLPTEKAGVKPVPNRFEPLEGVKPVDHSPEAFSRVKEMMGDQGLVGVNLINSKAIGFNEVYEYYEHPESFRKRAHDRIEQTEKRFEQIMSMKTQPDFLCVGGSGTLVSQTPEMFRDVAFPAVKRAIELATEAGIPTHFHSCGPEKELVKIFAEETTLTVIDPLEIPPMGDCDLAELKQKYGDRITLKGNLHTTDTMLRGTPDGVRNAARKAIDDAAEGGRFILSTGDQCGRDTPDENLHAMVETARTYGKYAG